MKSLSHFLTLAMNVNQTEARRVHPQCLLPLQPQEAPGAVLKHFCAAEQMPQPHRAPQRCCIRACWQSDSASPYRSQCTYNDSPCFGSWAEFEKTFGGPQKQGNGLEGLQGTLVTCCSEGNVALDKVRPKFLQYTATSPKAVAASAPRESRTCLCPLLTFTEDKIRGDVEGLDPHLRQQELHGLLVIAGDEGDGLLRLALVGAPGRGHQGREPVRAGRVLPGCPGDTQTSGPGPRTLHKPNTRVTRPGRNAAAVALLLLECPPRVRPCFCVTPHTATAAPTPGSPPASRSTQLQHMELHHKGQSWLCCRQLCSCHSAWSPQHQRNGSCSHSGFSAGL